MPIADGKMRLGERVEVPDPAMWTPPPEIQARFEAQSALKSIFTALENTLYFGSMGQYDIPRLLEGGVTALGCGIKLDDKELG
jgi:hypothetical protein